MRHTTNEIWFAEQRDLAMAERDEWKTRAERAEVNLRELRENILLGFGMTTEEVAAIDDDLIDTTISYLLSGHAELVARVAELEGQGWRPATTAEVATQSTVGVEIDGKSRLYTMGELLELYVRVSNDLETATTQLTKIGGVFEPSAPLSADAIIEAIKAMSREIDELGAEQRWRSVTDPPDEDGVYLVWRGHNIDPPPGWAEISDYATRSDVWRIDYPYGDSVTHWQPLPAPPQ